MSRQPYHPPAIAAQRAIPEPVAPVFGAINAILDCYEQATEKHPDDTWPKDIIHMTAIMMEEAGEAVRAANDVVHDDASLEPLRRELAQTGAMCLRCLINLEDRA